MAVVSRKGHAEKSVTSFVPICTERLVEKKRPSGPTSRAHKIGEKFCALTSREAEIGSLLALRLNAAEITTCFNMKGKKAC